jgi:DoxX-like family
LDGREDRRANYAWLAAISPLCRTLIDGGKMNAKQVAYWVTTALVAAELIAGGVTDLAHGREVLVAGQPVVDVLHQLGYPAYLLAILGVWKLLAAAAILAPGLPRLKEWAYAGTFFELSGAGGPRGTEECASDVGRVRIVGEMAISDM